MPNNFRNSAMLMISLIMNTSLCFAAPNFSALTQDEYNKITKEFSGNFVHPSISGAATLGSIFGVELALVAAQTASPNTNAIVQHSSSGDSLPNLYDAGILAAISVPLGFTGELIAFPKMTMSSGSAQLTSLAVKWTASETLLVLPFNLAVRGIYSNSDFSFSQTIASFDAKVTNSNKITGLQFLVSPKLPIFEPYAGIGLLNASNTLSVSGTPGTIFAPSVTLGQSADNKVSSTQLLLGVNVKILLFSLGAEYSKAFDASRYGIKLGMAF